MIQGLQLCPEECFNKHQTNLTPLSSITIGSATIYAMLEYLHGNTASIKDRVVGSMIDAAFRSGNLCAGGTVVEATSGSTGITAASECGRRGLRFVTVVPDSVPNEKTRMIQLLGGRVITVPHQEGLTAARKKAEAMANANHGWWYMNQFSNSEHVLAHHSTAREIVEQFGGVRAPICFCAGVGTGATLTGIYDYFQLHGMVLRPYVARIKSTACRMKDFGFSPVGFDNLFEQRRRYDHVFRESVQEIEVDENDAEESLRFLWAKGYPVGPASAINFAAARVVAAEQQGKSKTVTVFTDRVERYLGTSLVDLLQTGSSNTID